jgi:hypothetical protein
MPAAYMFEEYRVTLQDARALGHRGMQEWDGDFRRFGLPKRKHYWGDFGPVPSDIWDAT